MATWRIVSKEKISLSITVQLHLPMCPFALSGKLFKKKNVMYCWYRLSNSDKYHKCILQDWNTIHTSTTHLHWNKLFCNVCFVNKLVCAAEIKEILYYKCTNAEMIQHKLLISEDMNYSWTNEAASTMLVHVWWLMQKLTFRGKQLIRLHKNKYEVL